MRFVALVALAAIVLSGCSWSDDDEVQPVELIEINEEVTLEKIWDRKIGLGALDHANKLLPVVAGGRIFAASPDGNIVALEPGTGRVIWKRELLEFYPERDRATGFAEQSDLITGGVGAGGDIIVIGSFAGELVAMNQSDGSLAWRSKTTSEVLAPPQVDREMVVAQSIDGKVAAYSALDGKRRWVYTTSIPSLTLRGTSTPILNEEVVVAGFSNGRVVGLDRERGFAGMDVRVGVSQGKSDLERLVDIDGRMILVPPMLYVVSYQGNLVALDLTNGSERWRVPASSSAGLGEGFGAIYLSDSEGSVSAIDVRNGKEIWKNADLFMRQLTTPVTISSYVVVGDFEGYLHLIAQSDGRFVGRKRVYGGALNSPVVVDGSRLYVQPTNGRVVAYQLR